MKIQKITKTQDSLGDHGKCVEVHELIDWQIIQYRRAVDVHRRDLSKAEGHCVAWQDAEKDFNSRDRANMDVKWRTEYCGQICPSRENCLVALQFLHSRKSEPLYRAG